MRPTAQDHQPLYTPDERRRRDASRWTFVQGVLAPLQFAVFLVSLVLVVRYLATGNGGYDKLVYRDVPVPEPGPGEVLVRVLAAGVNNTDINTRVGWYSRSVTGATSGDGFAEAQEGDSAWGGGLVANVPAEAAGGSLLVGLRLLALDRAPLRVT